MIIDTNKAKRCAIYVFFDKDGTVDQYNHFLLKELRKSVDKIVILCNGDVCEDGLKRLAEHSDEIIKRPNEGFDITAYKEGMEHIDYGKSDEFDEIIVMNSTFYGPFYPFSEMFDEMAKKDLDFWGITKFHYVPFDPFGTIEYGYIPEHIQSYFMVFRRKFAETKDFMKYWKNLPKINNYLEAVGYFETVFTKKFSDKGYKWDVYSDSSELEGYTYEALRDFPRYMIEKKKCPILKRRSFFQNYEEALSRSGGEATKEAFDYIQTHTDYDTDMIWDNLLRLQNQADLKKRMQLNYVISSKIPMKEKTKEKLKVALVLHIYYVELTEFCCKYAKNMPEDMDIIVTAPNEEKLESIKKTFSTLEGRHIEYRVVGNIGRDVAPFLVGCKDIIDRYDLVCKVHDKKVYQVMPMSIGASWGFKCFENLLRNRTFIENVIETFKENKRLGLLTPPVPNHGPYYPTTGKGEWGDNFQTTKDLAKKLGMKVDMDPTKEPVAPLGSMFWFRTKALKVLFDHDWQYNEFPPEPIESDATVLHGIERIYPFCAQHEGYYSGWLMVDSYARVEMTNWNFLNKKLEHAAFDKVGICRHEELLNRIKNLN